MLFSKTAAVEALFLRTSALVGLTVWSPRIPHRAPGLLLRFCQYLEMKENLVLSANPLLCQHGSPSSDPADP